MHILVPKNSDFPAFPVSMHRHSTMVLLPIPDPNFEHFLEEGGFAGLIHRIRQILFGKNFMRFIGELVSIIGFCNLFD